MATVERWTGRETRLLRLALRLSVRTFAEDLGVSPRTVSKWESGASERTPRPELQAALDTLLRRASSEEQQRYLTGVRAFVPPGCEQLSRRQPEPPVGGAMAGQSAEEAAAFTVWWETTSTGRLAAEVMLVELQRLSTDYLNGSPEPVVAALVRLRTRIFDLLRRHQPPQAARDLHLAAGYACVLLGWLSGDLGHLGAAATHARAGSLFAETSGSDELRAWVYAVRSKTAFWLGDYASAARDALSALEEAPATSVRVLLAAQAADAWATAGALGSARAALEQVTAARQSVTGTDDVGGLLSCTPVREANYVSGVYQQLGDTFRAVTVADSALYLSTLQPVRSYATEAQIRLNQVDVFLEAGDMTAASEAIAPVLALPTERRLHTLTKRVSRMAVGLSNPHDRPASSDLRQRMLTFADEPLPTAG